MNKTIKHFLKGIIVGIGGVAPGLSGSVLLIIFGLYQKTLEALGTFLQIQKRNFTSYCHWLPECSQESYCSAKSS